ncbi:hypothetical protein SAMN04488498_110111 [Mesorhizobium albiziae]|uniref:Uncharacterized protein n=1 Tax=Neomesorhizobium albiziae TaxID=335020 RepID=A0A1I4BF18_9HYPH|nr:hypothetical protein [Mesorhizobium albiziae]GLS29845.1 hypothetical protein GCM10007937_15530 [Mesorhizobium albiziae]SFK67415.1 hypothetical protein SAMN04488498_110111 [Mesorhizobium albiziae]
MRALRNAPVSLRRLTLAAAAAALMLPSPASAVIIGTCTIIIGAPGTMTASPLLNVMGSRQPGGSAATATVDPQSLLCNILALLDCYSISTPAPAGFLSAPIGAEANLALSTIYRINGGADMPGNTPTTVANGSKTVQVDLTATKAAGLFPAGVYQAQVVLRCE